MATKFCPGGSNKSRLSYGALSMSQWMTGFSQTIKENTMPQLGTIHFTKSQTAMTLAGVMQRQVMLSTLTCRFYQKGTCIHKADHATNGQVYLHVCMLLSFSRQK